MAMVARINRAPKMNKVLKMNKVPKMKKVPKNLDEVSIMHFTYVYAKPAIELNFVHARYIQQAIFIARGVLIYGEEVTGVNGDINYITVNLVQTI